MASLYSIKMCDGTFAHLYETPSYAARCYRLLAPGDIVLALDVVQMDGRYREPLRFVLSHLGVGWVNVELMRRIP